MTRTGRRRGPSTTRAEILEAARGLFAAHGYEATTTRMIADAASVDQALVVRTFGGKEALFRASVEWPFDPAVAVPAVVAGPRRRIGYRLADLVLATWEDPAGRAPILAIVRSATVHEDARRLLTEFVTTQILVPVATAIDTREPALRADLLASHFIGLGLGRYVFCFEPLASIERERVVDITGAIVQRLLTADLGG
jgi:AcrR family transcriptional regulator